MCAAVVMIAVEACRVEAGVRTWEVRGALRQTCFTPEQRDSGRGQGRAETGLVVWSEMRKLGSVTGFAGGVCDQARDAGLRLVGIREALG